LNQQSSCTNDFELLQESTALMLAVQAENAAVVKLLLKHHADVNIHSYRARVPSLHHIHILHGLAMHSLCHQAMLHVPPASASISFLCQQQQQKLQCSSKNPYVSSGSVSSGTRSLTLCSPWQTLLKHSLPLHCYCVVAMYSSCCIVFMLLHCSHALALYPCFCIVTMFLHCIHAIVILQGSTALHKAVQQGSQELTQLLLASGADVNAKGYNANIRWRESYLEPDTVSLLICCSHH